MALYQEPDVKTLVSIGYCADLKCLRFTGLESCVVQVSLSFGRTHPWSSKDKDIWKAS